MKNILRTLVLVAAVVTLLPAVSMAQKTQMLANAIVKSVSGSTVTVTANSKDTTFAVDSTTKVTGKGIGTKSKAKGGKVTVADLLNEGDRVTVKYMEMGSTMHATGIEVTAGAKK
jgi:hypothetical protein